MWVGTRAIDAVPLMRLLPVIAIVACDYGHDVQYLESDVRVFSLEKELRTRHAWGNGHINYIGRGRLGQELLSFLASRGRPFQILSYSAAATMDQLMLNTDLAVSNLSIPVQQKLLYDDKVSFQDILRESGLEAIPGDVVLLGDLRFESVARDLGARWMLKLPVGSAGANVHLIDGQASLDRIQSRAYSAAALVQKFQRGISINLMGVIGRDVYLAPASVQVIGARACTRRPFEWCGNDFNLARYLSCEQTAQVNDAGARVAGVLKARGYRGMFGVDLLLDPTVNRLFGLELNPRFQGSTALLTQLEILNDRADFLVQRYVAAMRGEEEAEARPRWQTAEFHIGGAHVVINNRSVRPARVVSTIESGVYSWEGGALRRRRDGISLLDCDTDDEFVVTGGGPLEGVRLIPGAPLVWVQTRRPLLSDATTGELTKFMTQVCDHLHDRIQVAPDE